MANHKSAKRANQRSIRNAERNRSLLSRVKTFIKSLETLLLQNKAEEARQKFPAVESEVMKAVSKGVIKLNTASRKVSRLAKKVKATAITA